MTNQAPSTVPHQQPPLTMIEHRRAMLDGDFTFVLTAKAKGPLKEIEDQALALAQDLLPIAPPDLCAIYVRMIGAYVAKPKELVSYMVQRHYDVLHAYAYGAERDPKLREGFSDFWLFRATNQALANLDQLLIPGLTTFLHLNTHQVHAARAFLRMQAFHVDMAKIDNITKIHAIVSKYRDFRSFGHNLPGAEHFEIPQQQVDKQAAPANSPISDPSRSEELVNEPVNPPSIPAHLHS